MNLNLKTLLIVFSSLSFVLLINGAIPFVSMPTLGQAIWTVGFSQSFANQSIFDLHAINFGNPEPAAIAFGLAGAYPTSLFIRAGLHPADAYTLMVVFWISLAFFGTWKISRAFKLSTTCSSLTAILWLTMPIVWWHDRYSMLSLGIALLSFYLYTALRLFQYLGETQNIPIRIIIMYLFAVLIAIFMDGYTFMMFAIGSSILGGYAFWKASEQREILLKFSFPVHFFSFVLAYILYSTYIGKSHFDGASLNFFRGWGADLMFLIAPSHGVHWLWDTIGFNVYRTDREQFGDASVWATTFALPVIIIGSFAWWKVRKQYKLTTGFLLVAIFGFYMGLGPSLKINSVKPDGVTSKVMKQEYAVMPTGNAWLSKFVPGFNNMRAAYRWSALGFVGLWLLIVLLLSREQKTMYRWIVVCSVLFLIVSNLPNIEKKILRDINYRDDFFDIEHSLVKDLKQSTYEGERVAFIPYRNDFFANYLASRTKIHSYNIGGDKNLREARKSWPATMKQFKMGKIDSNFVANIILLLAREETDVVVLPYLDLLWAAHYWPAPLKFKEDINPVLVDLKQSSYVSIEEREFFSVVRLINNSIDKDRLERKILMSFCMTPVCLKYRGINPIPNQVGTHTGKGMKTDGRSGYLIYGPYKPMKSGEYVLQVTGKANSISDKSYIDVIWHTENKVYARFYGIGMQAGLEENVLLKEKVTLHEDVDALEIRVWVDEDTDSFVNGYSLELLNREIK